MIFSWVLVLTIARPQSAAIATVGFQTRITCEAAAEQWKKSFLTVQDRYSAICVPVVSPLPTK